MLSEEIQEIYKNCLISLHFKEDVFVLAIFHKLILTSIKSKFNLIKNLTPFCDLVMDLRGDGLALARTDFMTLWTGLLVKFFMQIYPHKYILYTGLAR